MREGGRLHRTSQDLEERERESTDREERTRECGVAAACRFLNL